MKHLLYKSFLICSFLLGAGVTGFAQSNDDQLLIFRNTGEVNLLYQSQIDSITMQNIDSAGVIYDEPIAQLFYTTDTVLYVPISEIDSVCFGNRNEVEFKSDVIVLDDSDIAWILSTYDNNILYKLDTPDSYLPKQGDKLFYGKTDDLFPYGLCATVVKVNKEANGYAVLISSLDISEVFEKFFYAGDFSDKVDISRAGIRATNKGSDIDKSISHKLDINVDGYGDISATIGMNIKGPVVLQPRKHIYSALLKIECICGYDITLECKENGKIEENTKKIPIPLGTIGGIFKPSIDLSLFLDLNAELKYKYHQDISLNYVLDWKRQDGENFFNPIKPDPDGPIKAKAKSEILLDGDIFTGLQADFNFAIIGDIIGARAKAKFGPHFEAHIEASVLSDLMKLKATKKWDPQLYAKGVLSSDLKYTIDFYATYREFLILGKVDERKIGDGFNGSLNKKTLNLFPEFDNTKATERKKEGKAEVSISTTSETPIEYPVETGFQVIDVVQDKIVDSLFVGDIRSNIETIQGVVADVEINDPVIAKDTLIVRPVFHYAGYTIPYKPVSVSDNTPIQPVISFGNTSSVIYASGIPIVGTYRNDSTTYHVGPYVPVGYKKNNVFSTFSTYIYGKSNGNNSPSYNITDNDLIGTWTSENSSTSLSLIFNDDKTGVLTEADSISQNFTYEINTPSKQYVSLITPDETIVLKIVSVENDRLTIFYRNHYASSMYVLNKKD